MCVTMGTGQIPDKEESSEIPTGERPSEQKKT